MVRAVGPLVGKGIMLPACPLPLERQRRGKWAGEGAANTEGLPCWAILTVGVAGGHPVESSVTEQVRDRNNRSAGERLQGPPSVPPPRSGLAASPSHLRQQKQGLDHISLYLQFKMNQLLCQLVLCLPTEFQHLPATEEKSRCTAQKAGHGATLRTPRPGTPS